MMGLFEEDKEVAQFMSLVDEDEKHRNEKRESIQFHSWSELGKLHTAYFAMLRISEPYAKYFGGVIPAPMKVTIHKNIMSSKKNSLPSMFPKAKVPWPWMIQHVENGFCHVCDRRARLMERTQNAMDAGDDKLVKNFKFLVNTKYKDQMLWVAKSFPEKEEPLIEVYMLPWTWWKQGIWKEHFEPRDVDIDDWKDTVDIDGLSDEEVRKRYLAENKPKNPNPFDMMKGCILRVTREGDFGGLSWKTKIRKPHTYLPLQYLKDNMEDFKKLSEEAQAGAKKLAIDSKENVEWIKKQFEENKVPDVMKWFGPISSEEQYDRLGIADEPRGSEIQPDDSVEVAGNKLDDLKGEPRASVELDDTTTIDELEEAESILKDDVVDLPF